MATVSSANTNVVSVSGLTTHPPVASATNGTAPTGTFTAGATGTEITGVGTNFTKFKVGDWIVDYTNFEIRKIVNIQSDLICTVGPKFSNALAGVTLVITPSSRVKYATLFGTTAAKINNVSMPLGVVIPLASEDNAAQHGNTNFIDPVFVDGTGGSIFITWRI